MLKKCYILTQTIKARQKLCPWQHNPVIRGTLHISWSHEHVAAVSAKATRVLNLLRRNVNFCSSEIKVVAFTSLFRPHLEYASAACLGMDNILYIIHTPLEISNSWKEYSVAERVLFIRIIGVPPLQALSYCPTSIGHPCHLLQRSTWHLSHIAGSSTSPN